MFISASNGAPIKTLAVSPNNRYLLFTMITRWAGGLLTYIDSNREVSNIYGMPVGGERPQQLTDFKTDTIFKFDWSGSRQLVVARGQYSNQVVLLRGFR